MRIAMRCWLAAIALLFCAHGAWAQPIVASNPSTLLYVNGVLAGNGADTTVDTLMTYNVPSGTLANIGDAIHIQAGGSWASSTDAKTVTVKFGSATASTINTSTAGVTRWALDIWVVKTGSNTQSVIALGANQGSSVGNGVNIATPTQTDTSPITVLVTGQNATNSVAGSVACQVLVVQYYHA